MSLSWRERLRRAKKRLSEQLELSQADWEFIQDNIGAFCTKSDEEIRAVLEAEGRPVNQEEIDKLVNELFESEFDEMTKDIIIEVLEQLGYEIKKKPKKKAKKKQTEEEEETETEDEDEQETESAEEQKEAIEVENK